MGIKTRYLLRLGKRRWSVLAVSLSLTLSGCTSVEIPNLKICTVAGKLSAGGICAETLTDSKYHMGFNEFVDFLEPQKEPERGAAVCMSSEHFLKFKNSFEIACRKLKGRCSKEAIEAVARVAKIINESKKEPRNARSNRKDGNL